MTHTRIDTFVFFFCGGDEDEEDEEEEGVGGIWNDWNLNFVIKLLDVFVLLTRVSRNPERAGKGIDAEEEEEEEEEDEDVWSPFGMFNFESGRPYLRAAWSYATAACLRVLK